jgi:hypothetical protein
MPSRPRIPIYVGLIVIACVVVYTLALLGVLYAIGVLDRPLIGPDAAADPPLTAMPAADVPGDDIDGLPRYPGSLRIEFTEERQGPWTVTEAEYLAEADPEEVREYFRDAFRANGWEVLSSDYSLGEWVYELASGDVTGIVEIEPRSPFIEIELEIQVATP